MTDRTRRVLALIGFIVLCQGAGALGALATDPGPGSWYASLNKPAFNPPPWLFGPVWITLYTLMAIAAWRVWRGDAPGRRGALILFGIQLALNAAWTPTFFGLEQIGAALAVICALLVALGLTIAAFWRVDRVAGGLLIPYLLWSGFATALTASILALNG